MLAGVRCNRVLSLPLGASQPIAIPHANIGQSRACGASGVGVGLSEELLWLRGGHDFSGRSAALSARAAHLYVGAPVQPIPARGISVHVRNRGAAPATITRAVARTELHGELTFTEPVELPAHGEAELRFGMSAPTAQEGLARGERVDVTIDYDGHQIAFAARWVGPAANAWQLIDL